MDNKWDVLQNNMEIENELVEKMNLNRLVAKILINRGIDSVESVEKFLYSTLEDLPSPMLMTDMDVAVDRIIRAIKDREQIVIFGDYDVDGMSSTSLLVNFFSSLNHPVSFYIPHRINEGYGLNSTAIKQFAEEGCTLLITVDCGVTSVSEVALASEHGIDVIITDHHQVSEDLPPAYALLNPSRKECGYPFKHLAGVGIAYKLVSALKDELVASGVIGIRDIPNLKRSLDLVSLGTLADMVPLIGENHLLVRFGLEEMAKSQKVGLRALMKLGNFGSRPIADTDIGFYIAPRLNAIGRLQNARMGVELLTTTDKKRAKEIAKKLDEENSKRQEIQNNMLQEVLSMVNKEVDLETDKAIVLASEGWHPGVIGIVASRVVEKFNLPTILLNIENGICRGSARSIPSFHIYNGLTNCKAMLMHFGGHKYAAGLTLDLSQLEKFRIDFIKIAGEGLPVEPQESVISIDARASIESLTPSLIEEIMELGPFGPQYPYPILLSEEVEFIGEPFFVGKRDEHVRFEVGDIDNGVDGIGFGVAEKYRERYKKDSKFDIVYSPALVVRNEMSKVVQIRLQDLCESNLKGVYQ